MPDKIQGLGARPGGPIDPAKKADATKFAEALKAAGVELGKPPIAQTQEGTGPPPPPPDPPPEPPELPRP